MAKPERQYRSRKVENCPFWMRYYRSILPKYRNVLLKSVHLSTFGPDRDNIFSSCSMSCSSPGYKWRFEPSNAHEFVTKFISVLPTVLSLSITVTGSSPGWAPLRSGLGQAIYTCAPLSPSSIMWYRPRV